MIATSTAVCVTALAAWFLLYAFVLTGLEEHGTQARLYDQFRLELASATAPLGGLIRPGSPVALVSAPRGGLHNVVVIEGTTPGLLTHGPGHQIDTPLPGQAGTSVMLGRSVMFGGSFRGISSMRVGDTITVTTAQGTFSYKVQDVRVPGDPGPRPLSPRMSRITLVTSKSEGWRSGWAPNDVVYVDALLSRGHVQPTPSGRPSTISSSARPMGNNPHALIPLIFWLQGLAVAVGAVVWSLLRKGPRPTWMIGLPVLVAVLWGASGAVTQLLPNLL